MILPFTLARAVTYRLRSKRKTREMIQSGAADRSLGFEDEDLRSSPGLLGQ